MEQTVLVVAGVFAMLIAGIHGYLGERYVVAPSTASSASSKRIMQAVMFLSAIYWFAAGAALIVATRVQDTLLPNVLVLTAVAVLMSGALANFWATRFRHFGGYALLITSGCAASSYLI